MFSDLVGSTVPSARDPEDLRELISAYTERHDVRRRLINSARTFKAQTNRSDLDEVRYS
jgi:hypothetical protein